MYIQIQNSSIEKNVISLPTVSENFGNTLNGFPNIFFNNEVI